MPITDEESATLRERGLRIHRDLKEIGLFMEQTAYNPEPEDGNISYGEGYPIIGLEKFLGYYDADWNIAYSPSISMTTDFSKAKAFCRYVKDGGKDAVVLDGVSSGKYTKRMSKALDQFRKINRIGGSFQFYITRERRYKEAKGLGESASIAAAAARALVSNVFGRAAAADDRFVSRYARLVSGSGTRSVAGGISLWLSYPGIEEAECYAEKMDIDHSRLRFFAFPEKSAIETISAHTAATKSEFYSNWIYGKYDRIAGIASKKQRIDDLLPLAEADMFRLDSVLMSGGYFVHDERSMHIISRIMSLGDSREGIYMTADTGPSIVLMSTDRDSLDKFREGVEGSSIEGHIPGKPGESPSVQDSDMAEAFYITR